MISLTSPMSRMLLDMGWCIQIQRSIRQLSDGVFKLFVSRLEPEKLQFTVMYQSILWRFATEKSCIQIWVHYDILYILQ